MTKVHKKNVVACLGLGALLSAGGCTLGDRTSVGQSWLLDRPRILGVRAEPAEPVPGDTVTFERYVFVPSGAELRSLAWVGCVPRSPNEVSCDIPEELEQELVGVDPDALSEQQLDDLLAEGQPSGLIGLEPAAEPAMVIPPNMLDMLEPDQLEEGTSAVVQLWAVVPELDDVEIAAKRLPVSLATTPNHNPDLTALQIDGELLADGGTFTVSTGEEITLEPVLAADAIEAYHYITDDGDEEEREEDPMLSWYTEDGLFDRYQSFAEDGEVLWTAPDGTGSSVIVCVVRDRRGGMGWLEVTMVVE